MSVKKTYIIFLSLLIVLAAGCRSVPMLPGLTAHKIDIQQGNVVTKDMLEKLQPGMTRSQVRFVLGTPLLIDPFRNDRWDYVYVMNRKGERVEQRQLKVFFQDDKMLRYEGDTVTDAQVAQEQAMQTQATPVPDKPADTRGFFARLFGWNKPKPPAQTPTNPPQDAAKAVAPPAPATAK
jgi:outer membrane protein assembly factor BamE